MALNKEVYREFEDVVGVENICDDPAIMPAYHNNEFAAVILPGNTAEVQAVVRLCNKHKIQFRPICTGWTGAFTKDIILLDLRRMNRIIEINEKNMYAVVEPYVISAQLHERAFKEHYFAMTFGPQDEIGPALSNYHLWWEKIKKAIDPNGITPPLTALV